MNHIYNYLTAHPSQKGGFEIRLTTMIAIILIIFSSFYIVSCKDAILPNWVTGPSKQQLIEQNHDLNSQITEAGKINDSMNTQLELGKDTEKINTDTIIEHTKELAVITVVAEKIKTNTQKNIKKIKDDPALDPVDKQEKILNEALSGILEAYNQLPVKENLDA